MLAEQTTVVDRSASDKRRGRLDGTELLAVDEPLALILGL